MNMNKNQYVDSVMRALGNSSIELTLDDLEELQILLESEYDSLLKESKLTTEQINRSKYLNSK